MAKGSLLYSTSIILFYAFDCEYYDMQTGPMILEQSHRSDQ